MILSLRKFLFVCFNLVGGVLMAQSQDSYTSVEAYSLFNEGDYLSAEKAYEYLLSKFSSNATYSFYYGACLLENNKDIPQAVRRLKYASVKNANRNVGFYLGRAYQLRYNFEEAIRQFSKFLQFSNDDSLKVKAQLYLEECKTGKTLSAKIYSLEILSRDTVKYNHLLTYYRPSKDVGQVMYNRDFFESGIEPTDVLYLTERGDEVYYSLNVDPEKENDLYKMEKLIDGWGEGVQLAGINSDKNDKFPFLLLDGLTLYFSSDREGGMGGYDIYKSIYDAEKKVFSEPVNMGIPFNSPADDLLFVTDEFNSVAWFASNRETNGDDWIVYQLSWNDGVVKSLVTDMNQVVQEAQLLLTEKMRLDKQAPAENKLLANALDSDVAFTFVVNDTITYTDLSHFNSRSAKDAFEGGMTLRNNFV